MTVDVITDQGRRYTLPDPVSWQFEYACGVPCDSFRLVAPWREGEQAVYRRAVRLEASHEGQRVFTGVVDEVEWEQSGQGSLVSLSGRSLAALLLDNEAEAADYTAATLEDILRDHVAPYGIQVGEKGTIPACQGFSVASGSSEWQVLYDFVRFHGGVPPRFDRLGRLELTPLPETGAKVLDDTVSLLERKGRERRYGVLSEVVVRDKRRRQTERVVNAEFQAQGGRARRVMTMSAAAGARAMRYSGQFQLDKSAAQRRRLELTVPKLFFAWPGELVYVSRTGWGENGRWRVLETTVSGGTGGGRTALVLGEPDAVI